MSSNNPNPISAYIGIAGAVGMSISDVILLSVPGAGWESDMSSFSSLAHVSQLRFTIGPLIGLVCSFFICFGFWYVGQKVAHLSEKLSMLMFISLTSVMFFGGAFHAGYYFAGHALYIGDVTLYKAFIYHVLSEHPGFIIGDGDIYLSDGFRTEWLSQVVEVCQSIGYSRTCFGCIYNIAIANWRLYQAHLRKCRIVDLLFC